MSENCTHNCETCHEACADRDPKSMLKKPHELSDIKNVIAVVSGKGGVGKSLVTSLLASSMQKKGYHTAILDADITGPSIPGLSASARRHMPMNTGFFPQSQNSA